MVHRMSGCVCHREFPPPRLMRSPPANGRSRSPGTGSKRPHIRSMASPYSLVAEASNREGSAR